MVFNYMVITLWNHHDQDGHNLVESLCKCIVFGQNNNKLRGLLAQSKVHNIERLEEQIICWEIDLYWE